MRLTLVANHESGGTTDAEAIAARLRSHGAIVTTVSLHDVGRAPLPDADRIVVAGGDGSIAPAAAAAPVPLAVVPTGTANDFARALGLPDDIDAACALAAGPEAPTRAIELGLARPLGDAPEGAAELAPAGTRAARRGPDGPRPFVNAASCGLSVVATRRAEPLKPRLGPLAYAVGALRAGLSGRPLDARVAADGRIVHAGRAWQVIVGATGAFGGGSGIAEADPRDGLLDVVVLPAGSRGALLRRAWGLRSRRIARQRGVVHAQAGRIDVEVAAGTPWNVDGEVCRLGAVAFTAQQGGVEVVVP